MRKGSGKAAFVVLAAWVGISAGCAAPPEGLARTGDGEGPRVVFDLQHRPLPEIPFPNDIATRPDPTSPTGQRINASLVATTELEEVARRRIDELSGFGVYQPLTVRFDAPLDITSIYARHRDYRNSPDGSDYDFSNDVVYLIDVTPDSPTYLQPVPLDFGEGNFPVLLRTPHQYWEHDPKTITKALVYETYDEDWNGNGELDPGEDLDLDGMLDHANHYPLEDGDPGLNPLRDLVSFYEFETNTLIFRPVLPLRERTTYAVVLTKDLRGANGDPVRSPFAFVNHTSQTDDLLPAISVLEKYGHSVEDIAFGWTFTTHDATSDLVMLRNGIYGQGPMAWLAEDNPPELVDLFEMRDLSSSASKKAYLGNAYVLPQEQLRPIVGPLASAAFGNFGISQVEQLLLNQDFYAYHVSGRFRTPWLLDTVESDNLDERAWPANLRDPALRDRITYREVQFWCAIPKKQFKADPNAPAPVVLYAHGYTSNKIEQLGLALHAKFGIAGCSIDAVLHGIDVGDQLEVVENLFDTWGMLPGADALLYSRAEDMDSDGVVDIGGEFFSAYTFKTRDNLRQTLLDWLGLVRLIRSFGEGEMLDVNGDGKPETLGDFDADGFIDIGGNNAVFFASGTSLGGLISSMLSAIEPGVVAAAPIAGGAGLVDLTIRSEQGGVVEAVGLRLLGPAIVGEPGAQGGTRIYQLYANGNKVARQDIAIESRIEPGDVVMVTNEANGEARCARVMPDDPPPGYENFQGWEDASNCSANDAGHCRTCAEGTEGTYACDLARTFRVAVPADKGDPLKIEVLGGPDSVRIEGEERDCVALDDAEVKAEITKLSFPVQYRGNTWAPGDDLVAFESGFGFQRGTPALRRFSGLAQMTVEPADPALYAVRYARDPLTFDEDGEPFQKPPTNVLNVTTLGDPNVPVNTGVAIAKVAGFIELFEPDQRYGKTPNRVIIEEGVQEGIPWLEVRGPEWGPVLVDVDNLSESANTIPMDPTGSNDERVAPRLSPPLRLVAPTFGATEGMSGIVLPLQNEFEGRHGFPPPGLTDGPFDEGQYMEHQLGIFFRSFGTEVRYDRCMAELDTCPDIPSPPPLE